MGCTFERTVTIDQQTWGLTCCGSRLSEAKRDGVPRPASMQLMWLVSQPSEAIHGSTDIVRLTLPLAGVRLTFERHKCMLGHFAQLSWAEAFQGWHQAAALRQAEGVRATWASK